MNTVRTTVRKGFTLVEILIVVVILGILAAIVIPQFSSASQAAQASSLVTQLQSLRSQLELYQLQHNGNYPGLNAANTAFDSSATFWTDMAGVTDVDGDPVAAADVATTVTFGPYLQKPIENPFTRVDTVVDSGTAAAAGQGWSYNPLTGRIVGVIPAAVQADINLDDDAVDGDVVVY